MNQIFKLTLILFFSSHACAQTNNGDNLFNQEQLKQGISAPNLFISNDSEGFSTQKWNVAYLNQYEHGERYTGIKISQNKFSQSNWTTQGYESGVIFKNINPRSALGYNLSISATNLAGHQYLTTDSTYSLRVTDSTKLELSVNRDVVETRNSIINGIYFTTPGLSVEQQITERLALVLYGGVMHFSDSNTRQIIKARLIYDALPEYGVNFQIRHRRYQNSNTSSNNNYFNPESYDENALGLGLRKRIQGWVLSGTLAVGQQQINSDQHTSTQLFEITITSPIVSNIFFKSRAGYSKSGGLQGPDYSYRYIAEEIIFNF